MSGEQGAGGVFDRWWVGFTALPRWVRVALWIVFWPLLLALRLARSPRLGRAGPPLGGAVLLLLAPLWTVLVVALVAGPPPDEPAIVGQEETERRSPSRSPAPDDPSPRPGPSPAPDDEGGDGDGDLAGDDPAAVTPDADRRLEVHFIDVGQADATLLRAPDATVLIDTGDWQRSDVVPYLRSQGVDQLDVVMVTHPHADHLGQFDQVMAAIDVAEVWWSGATHTTRTFERALDALEASDAAYEEPRAGETTAVGSLRFEFVNPPPDADFGDLHDSNLATRVTYGDVRFLFTGDAEAPTEARMVRRHRDLLDADVYQVGHHGSSTSTSPPFLDVVTPAVAIYSAGQDNAYGHPHDEVIARLGDAEVEVLGTDSHGSIVVTTDGSGWTIATER